ncbi:alpha/beta hydrolase [Serratia plymuthica]|nr:MULTISPECIES: alpha/beta hydrolase [Serratia]UTN95588.1 alpha/beta hydrolase [Serratia plymuthica]
MTSPILLLPGIGNSGSGHWQTLWTQTDASMTLISGQDWDHPVCEEWVENLETAVRKTGPDVILVAHSLGCLQVANWAQYSRTVVRGLCWLRYPIPHAMCFQKSLRGLVFPLVKSVSHFRA